MPLRTAAMDPASVRKVCRTQISPEPFLQLRDGVGRNALLRSFLTGMDKAKAAPHRIDQIDSAAIGNINSEANVGLIAEETIAAGKAAVRAHSPIDHRQSMAVHLFCRKEFAICQAKHGAHFSMHGIEPRQRFRFVVAHVNARHPSNESMAKKIARFQRGKSFDR